MDSESPEILRAVIFEAIENQLRNGNPPETRQTYDRLILEGHTEEEAVRLIGCVMSEEIFQVMKERNEFLPAERKTAIISP